MIKLEHVVLASPEQMEFIIEGMRNPMNSWEKSDSEIKYESWHDMSGGEYILGHNDRSLMQRLSKTGTDHRKFMRMMPVYVRITAPLYWWKEFDTYKVGTVANSCSTMHKIHAKEFTLDDFSHEHLREAWFLALGHTIDLLNDTRKIYLESGEKADWWQMIQILPSSYNQKRTITMNYENVMNMVHQREHHKLDEWIMFVENLKKLPYVKDIRGDDNV